MEKNISTVQTEGFQRTFLKDYVALSFQIATIQLTVELFEHETIVTNTMIIEKLDSENIDVCLNGEELELLWVQKNGERLSESDYDCTQTHLIIRSISDLRTTLTIKTRLYPHKNLALEGLYKSGSIYCTQNEPEGFRRITYFCDRPDMMSQYTTTIHADKKKYPILLANGNKVADGDLEQGRHFVTWRDPFPKPSYLFAMVAGDFDRVSDTFITCTGKHVALEIYVDMGSAYKCAHALASLKKAMRWDEDIFGLEYDLDIYMIVAVDAFNMGAMENKGLNIFNSQYVLADPKSATDADYQGIERVIAHEYFHNWTGNRVTCRDWFQLTLKEGLTVFRDEEFTADMHSRPVKRIQDVRVLREYQFLEDSGPMAHPIRPASYAEINNFYTATVYNKGAEVIRMIHTIIGKDAFRKGIDLYFETFDGKAVCTEDFLWAMQMASGTDLSGFTSWYNQAGTPVCQVSDHYDETTKQYSIKIHQSCPKTPEAEQKDPFIIPVALGLIGQSGHPLRFRCSGKEVEATLWTLSQENEELVLDDVSEKPVPSLLRHFSAPVILKRDYTTTELKCLMQSDTDLFNRYEASQRYSYGCLVRIMEAMRSRTSIPLTEDDASFYTCFLNDAVEDPSFVAQALSVPSVPLLVEHYGYYDYQLAYEAREYFITLLASVLAPSLRSYYVEQQAVLGDTSDSHSMAKRLLKNKALHYLVRVGEQALIKSQFEQAKTMTDSQSALKLMVHHRLPGYEQALSAFYHQWVQDPLVMNKWFAIQASSPHESTLEQLKQLELESSFDLKNPNKMRALYGTFISNHHLFHHPSGSGYDFIGKKISLIDSFNPSLSSRLAKGFSQLKKLPELPQSNMKKVLETLHKTTSISTHLNEVLSAILAY